MQSNSGLLYIKKRSIPECLTYVILIMPFFLSFLQSFLGLPGLVKYIIDACWMVALLSMVLTKKIYLKRDVSPAVYIFVAFFSLAIIVYLFNFQSPFYFLWGIRNNLRFYIAFLAFTVYFCEEDMKNCLKFMDIFFWVNTAVVFYQFFVLGYEQDYLGGIFGVEKGCNAYLIVHFAIVSTKAILSYFDDKESAISCFAKCGIILLISVMAELKFFFVMFVLILVASSIITKFSFKKVFLYIISFFFIMVASVWIVDLFGENRAIDLDSIIDLIFASNYATSRDFGRFTAIPTIDKYYLTEPLEKIFGLGLGNCDTSSFAICNTPFFKSHQHLNYTWFSSAFLFLETGYIGLALYLLFFVVIFFLAFKKLHQGNANKLFCQMSMIMSMICFILTFYNSSLRMETGYLAFFVLALPFVENKVKAEQQN